LAPLLLAEDDYGPREYAPASSANLTTGPDNFTYFALQNHPGPSGVPLRGIGVGYFCYAPDGRFTRFAINNWQDQGGEKNNPIIKDVRGTFLAAWDSGSAHVLQIAKTPLLGMPPAKKTVYRGLFPIAENTIDDHVRVRAWSGLAPHNAKDSSLPVVWMEVNLSNPSAEAHEMSVAFSWEDIIGRKLCDIRDLEGLKKFPHTFAGQTNYVFQSGREWYDWMPRVATKSAAYQVGNFHGIRQSSTPLQPVVRMLQNYNAEIAILAEEQAGVQLSVLPAYEVANGDEAWASFRKDGQFSSTSTETPLFDPVNSKERASAIAVKCVVPAKGEKTVRFLVAWFAPEIKISPSDDPYSFFGKTDYNHYYQNYFPDLDSLVRYATENRERIFAETSAWHAPVLASSYPDWLKFKLINSAYTLYTNTILTKGGDFTVLEGAMRGLAGTMDQRLAAHPFYQKFFPELDRRELETFGHNPGKNGQILHFDGMYYLGLSAHDGSAPMNIGWMVDNSGGWLVQLARIYQQTGDKEWIAQFKDQIPATMDFLSSLTLDKKGQPFFIPEGSTTYDDFWHPPLYAYNASCWPAFLRAGSVLYRALGDEAKAAACEKDSTRAADDFVRALWNGKFFAYGAERDGSKREDDIMFSGQLAGQFLSRYCGWGDILPLHMVRKSLAAQMQTNVVNSPDDYAPKVWSISSNQAFHDPRRPEDKNNSSTCWPFYLESYTAMAAIQAGMVHDGLDIMRHIQLVNLRQGWAWSQNLWHPDELTYMTAPVTWFITDVLTGAALDIPTGELTLGPVALSSHDVLPIFFPNFWAQLENDPGTGRLKLRVLKTFGAREVIIHRLKIQPNGTPTTLAKTIEIAPFTVKAGAMLDLDAYAAQLNAAQTVPPLLPASFPP